MARSRTSGGAADIEGRFFGLDQFNAPQHVAEGFLTRADNCIFDGHEVVSRPGFVGLLTSAQIAALGGPVYPLLEFTVSGGASFIILTAGGHLYKYTLGGNTLTEITANGTPFTTIVSAKASAIRAGAKAFIIDGTNAMIQTDGTNAGTSYYTGLNAPQATPTSSLTNATLDPFTAAATTWVGDTQSGTQTNRIGATSSNLTAGFPAGNPPKYGQGGYPTGGGWGSYSQDQKDAPTTVTNPSGGGLSRTGTWMLVDDWEGIFPTSNITNDTISSDATKHPKLCYLQYDYLQLDTTGKDGFELYVYALDNGGAVIDSRSEIFIPPYAGQNNQQNRQFVADFSGVTQEIFSYTFRVGGKQGNGHSSSSVYLTNIVCYPFIPLVTASGGPGSYNVGISLLPNVGTLQSNLAAYQGTIKGLIITKDYTAGALQNWFGYNIISIALAGNYLAMAPVGGGNVPGLAFHLEFQQNGSSVWYRSNSATVSINNYASIDISTVPAAVRQSFQKIRIVFDAGFSNTTLLAPVFNFGPITGAGNLSVNNPATNSPAGPYTWYWTEVNATADPSNVSGGVQLGLINVIESDPSPGTLSIFATGLQAEANIISTNAAFNASTTHLFLYRLGGVLNDGIPRLVAKVPIGSDYAYGADVSNITYSWNHTTRTLLDNTPDSALQIPSPQIGLPMVVGRGAPPVGASAIAEHQDRLWLSVGSNLYGSWLLPAASNAAIYFNQIVNLNDPSIIAEGGLYVAGGADGDSINALVSFANALVVLKQRQVYVLTGQDPTSFALQSFLHRAGTGNLAPKGTCFVDNTIWFTGPQGLQEFNADTVTITSKMIQKLLNPSMVGGTPLQATAYSNIAMAFHGEKVYLAAPADYTVNTNTAVYVYDTHMASLMPGAGWSRWFPPVAITSFVALGSSTDTNDLYCGGVDKQLYQIKGAGDVAYSGASAVSVNMSLATPGMGEEAGGTSLVRQKIASRFYAVVTTGESTTLTYGANPPNPAFNYSATYGVQAERAVMRKDLPSTVRGDFIEAVLQVNTVTQSRVSALGLEMSAGRLGA